jgi:DNA-binding GntR family transcriptional regulator
MMSDRLTVERGTLADRTYDMFLDALLRGDVKPGDRLRLDALAGQLGTSLAPLREAVARLRAEGILSDDRRRGVYVASLSAEDVARLCEARLLLESFAAEKAVPAATGEQLEGIRTLVQEYAALTEQTGAASRLAWVRKDMELHQYLVDLAGNARVSTWFSTLAVHLHVVLLRPEAERSPRVTISEHQAIYQAFAMRDSQLAKAAVTAHITAAKQWCFETAAREFDAASLGERV